MKKLKITKKPYLQNKYIAFLRKNGIKYSTHDIEVAVCYSDWFNYPIVCVRFPRETDLSQPYYVGIFVYHPKEVGVYPNVFVPANSIEQLLLKLHKFGITRFLHEGGEKC